MDEETNTYQEVPEQSTYDTYLEELGNTDFVDNGLQMMMPPEVDYEDKINDMLGL